MTTQTCKVTVSGPRGAIGLTATCTDDTFTELKDDVNTLSLYQVAKGMPINMVGGYYTAGSGIFRVRNTLTNAIKILDCLPMVKGAHIWPIKTPFVVQDNDILEVYCTVAGT